MFWNEQKVCFRRCVNPILPKPMIRYIILFSAHAHAHPRTRIHTHAYTHKLTHTHTHISYVIALCNNKRIGYNINYSFLFLIFLFRVLTFAAHSFIHYSPHSPFTHPALVHLKNNSLNSLSMTSSIHSTAWMRVSCRKNTVVEEITILLSYAQGGREGGREGGR